MGSSKALAIGVASAVTFGTLYVACALAVLLFPDSTIALFNTWMHGIDLTLVKRPPSKPIGAGELGGGLVTALIVSFAFGALFGWAYGQMSGRR